MSIQKNTKKLNWLFIGFISFVLLLVFSSFSYAEIEFYEEVPAWRMPELAVINLIITPERSDPGDLINITATISNVGKGVSPNAVLSFHVDGVKINRVPIDPLKHSEAVDVKTLWQAVGPGRHQVRANLELAEGGFDGNMSNNFLIGVVRVSGEAVSQPELQFVDIDFDSLPLIPGQPCRIPLKVRNPSFTNIAGVPLKFYIDGEYISSGRIDHLPPGSEKEFLIPWNKITPGEHNIVVKSIEYLKGWLAVVPDSTVEYSHMQKDKWVSIGPKILDNGWGGRMNTIAFHPKFSETGIMYSGGWGFDAGPPAAAGVWKTTNSGNSWLPVGDQLSSLMVQSVAVDPKYPEVVYAGGPEGIFKSTDSGNTWWHFALPETAKDIHKIVVRYTDSGQVMVYIRCNRGVLRYKSGNAIATFSHKGEWDVIKQAPIYDLVVHPTNSSILLASVPNDGIYRTVIGENAKEESTPGDHHWHRLASGLPAVTSDMSISLDIHRLYTNVIYAGIRLPEDGYNFAIYRSWDGGTNWSLVKKYADGELDDSIYNPYLRVVSEKMTENYLPEVIYFGGVDLYQFINYEPIHGYTGVVPQGGTFQVSGYMAGAEKAGVDMKTLEFDPANQNTYYYSAGDQGIFRCSINATPEIKKFSDKQYGKSGDQCTTCNDNLRVTQFYDFDVSKTNANLIIGGTQDTGTLGYTGNPTWKIIKGGDGMYSLINPNNDNILYAQQQSLNSTVRSSDGGNTWPDGFYQRVPKNFSTLGYITMVPSDPDGVIALGDDGNGLLYTIDGGKNWEGFNFWQGKVSQVIVHPTTFDWIVGTDRGQLFLFSKSTLKSRPIFTHPYGARVDSLSISPVDPNMLYVTFRTGGINIDTRIYYIQIDFSIPSNSVANNITSNFPENLNNPNEFIHNFPMVIVGDPYVKRKAYIGTEKGVWCWNPNKGGNLPWDSYNDGLPLTTIVDLLIAPDKSILAATKGRGAWAVTTGP